SQVRLHQRLAGARRPHLRLHGPDVLGARARAQQAQLIARGLRLGRPRVTRAPLQAVVEAGHEIARAHHQPLDDRDLDQAPLHLEGQVALVVLDHALVARSVRVAAPAGSARNQRANAPHDRADVHSGTIDYTAAARAGTAPMPPGSTSIASPSSWARKPARSA